MAKIDLAYLVIENFRSFRETAVVEFSLEPGLKFLGGANVVEPRLGANGAGKSSTWDALFWCLFNTTVRGLKASDVASWGAPGRPHVVAGLLIDGQEVSIERWGSPNNLTLDGEPIEQAELESIIGLDRQRAAQSLIFGQMMPLFLDLSIPERSALFDSVLDLSVWQRASDKAAESAKGAQVEAAALEGRIQRHQGMLDALPSREVLEADRAAWDKLHALDVSNALEWLEELEERAAEKPPAIDFALLDLDSQLSDLWDAEKVNRAAAKEAREATAKARADWKAAEEQRRRVEDLKQAGKCPTCGQATDTPHVHDSAIHLGEEVAGLAADGGKYSRAQAAIEAEGDRIAADIRQAQEARANAQARRDAARQSYERTKRDLDLAAEKAERLIAEDNPHDAALAGMLEKRAAWGKIVTDAQQDKDDHEAAALHFEFWQKNFKAVRLYQVQQILAQFELEVANAASVLGLVGWRISFATETETKGRTIKQGIQVRIESPTAEGPWEAWSGGEGQRIRLAVAIGLASLIHARAGVQFGFEVWDEPSAWLSPEGIEDLLECLKYRAQITGKSVWLLDHRALVHSGFAEMWQATKTSAGTQLERLR